MRPVPTSGVKETPPMSVIRCLILDVDGTLVDSNDAHARSWVDALAEAGISVSLERTRSLIGMGSDKLLPELAGIEVDSEQGQRLSEHRAAIFKERYLPYLAAFPRVRDLLLRLRADGVKLVVASSAREDELQTLLEIAGAADLVAERTSSSDADRSKPDPDIVQVALESGGCPSDATLMLGDTPYDIEAARKAGIGVIAVRCGGWGDAGLSGALAIYADPADVLAHYDGSPICIPRAQRADSQAAG
jgi:HAD superfamily hydrolase (TIGR01549 family)